MCENDQGVRTFGPLQASRQTDRLDENDTLLHGAGIQRMTNPLVKHLGSVWVS